MGRSVGLQLEATCSVPHDGVSPDCLHVCRMGGCKARPSTGHPQAILRSRVLFSRWRVHLSGTPTGESRTLLRGRVHEPLQRQPAVGRSICDSGILGSLRSDSRDEFLRIRRATGGDLDRCTVEEIGIHGTTCLHSRFRSLPQMGSLERLLQVSTDRGGALQAILAGLDLHGVGDRAARRFGDTRDTRMI